MIPNRKDPDQHREQDLKTCTTMAHLHICKKPSPRRIKECNNYFSQDLFYGPDKLWFLLPSLTSAQKTVQPSPKE